MSTKPTKDMYAQRANPPGTYHCPNCGETLSGPARAYLCPLASPLAKAMWAEAA